MSMYMSRSSPVADRNILGSTCINISESRNTIIVNYFGMNPNAMVTACSACTFIVQKERSTKGMMDYLIKEKK